MPDQYTYANSEVLKNNFGIKDSMLLHAYERKYVTKRLTELFEAPTQGDFDLKHLKEIHRHLFQDVYTWAGQIRQIDIGKVDQLNQQLHEFCPSERIEGFAEDIARSLKKVNYLKDFSKDEFSQKAAIVMGELNELHPFREGNGRTQREFMRQLGVNAGWELNFTGISKERMIEASVAAMRMDYRQLDDLIKESLKPLHMEQTQEYMKRIQEIKAAPDTGNPSRITTQQLYDIYAKKALNSNQGTWRPELDRDIVYSMKKDGISDSKIHTALTNSPSMVGLSRVEKSIKCQTLARDVVKKHPEFKSTGPGMSF